MAHYQSYAEKSKGAKPPNAPAHQLSLHKNILANYLGRAYSVGSAYLFVPFYIGILGVESYGLIGFYAVILTLTSLADVGLSTTFAREAARERDNAKLLNLLTTMERVLAASTSLLALIIFLFADVIATKWLNTSAGLGPDETATTIRLMACTLIPQLIISLYISGLLGLQRQELANGVQALYTTIRSGLVIIPIYFSPSLIVFFSWQLATSVAFMIVARTVLLRKMGHSGFGIGRYSLSTLRPQMKFAGGMMAISVIASINTQLDKIVVSKLFTVTDLGYYTLAGLLAQLPVAVTLPVMVALFPRFTVLNELGDHAKVSSLYESYSFMIALLCAIGAFGLLFFAGDVLSIWLGRSDVPDEIASITRLLASGGLFLSLASMPFYLGLASGHNKTSIILGLTTLIVTVPMLFVATRQFGMIGAAMPWVALNIFTFLVLSIVINRRFYNGSARKWFIYSTALPASIGASGMLVARLLSDVLSFNSIAACSIATFVGIAIIMGSAYKMRARLILS